MPSHLSTIARRLLTVSALVLLTACSQKIDGTSMEAFQASFKDITAKMSKDEAQQFDKDLTTILRTKGLNLGQLREYVNGMSAVDVHKAAKDADTAFKRARLTHVEAEIARLEGEATKADDQMAQVAKFGVVVNDIKGQWKLDPQGYERPENQSVTLSLTLSNNTPYAVKKVHYGLDLSIDGQARGPDPWSYELEKPLAPGQAVTVLLTDKGTSEADSANGVSSRVTTAIFEALKTNPNASLSATLQVRSIVLTDGKHLDAEVERSEGLLRELREEKATLTAALL